MSGVLTWAPLFYVAFGFLDWAVFRDQIAILMGIRVTFAAISLSCLWLVRRSTTYTAVVLITVIAFVSGSLGIAAMCHLTGGISSPYYAGLILCFLFAAALFTWPLWVSFLSLSVPLLVYFGPFLLGLERPDALELKVQGFFLVSSFSIALIGMSMRNRLAFKAYRGEVEVSRRNRELADLHELKDRMFQNVSHELRTPLTMMLTPPMLGAFTRSG